MENVSVQREPVHIPVPVTGVSGQNCDMLSGKWWHFNNLFNFYARFRQYQCTIHYEVIKTRF